MEIANNLTELSVLKFFHKPEKSQRLNNICKAFNKFIANDKVHSIK